MSKSLKEQSLVLLKPDAMMRGLSGEIIRRIEQTGCKIVGMKMIKPEEQKFWDHYNKDDAWFVEKGAEAIKSKKERGDSVEKEAIEYGRDIIRVVVESMMITPIIAIVFEGPHAVAVIKKIVGETQGLTAPAGTIRGDLSTDSYGLADECARGMKNLIHCTDEVANAQREVTLWFSNDELHDYARPMDGIMG